MLTDIIFNKKNILFKFGFFILIYRLSRYLARGKFSVFNKKLSILFKRYLFLAIYKKNDTLTYIIVKEDILVSEA